MSHRFHVWFPIVIAGLTFQAAVRSPSATGGPPPAAVERPATVTASWYGLAHHGKTMANGEPFDRWAFTCAHKELPLGSWVRVSTPDGSVAVVLEVTDRGPYVEGRDLDVSRGAADILGLTYKGVGQVLMEEWDGGA